MTPAILIPSAPVEHISQQVRTSARILSRSSQEKNAFPTSKTPTTIVCNLSFHFHFYHPLFSLMSTTPHTHVTVQLWNHERDHTHCLLDYHYQKKWIFDRAHCLLSISKPKFQSQTTTMTREKIEGALSISKKSSMTSSNTESTIYTLEKEDAKSFSFNHSDVGEVIRKPHYKGLGRKGGGVFIIRLIYLPLNGCL